MVQEQSVVAATANPLRRASPTKPGNRALFTSPLPRPRPAGTTISAATWLRSTSSSGHHVSSPVQRIIPRSSQRSWQHESHRSPHEPPHDELSAALGSVLDQLGVPTYDGRPAPRSPPDRRTAARLLRDVLEREVQRRVVARCPERQCAQEAEQQVYSASVGGGAGEEDLEWAAQKAESYSSASGAVGNQFEVEKRQLARPPSFNRRGKLGAWLSKPDGSPTQSSRAIYTALVFYSVAWLFFGIDGQGIMNKMGCRRADTADGSNVGSAGCNLDSAESLASVLTHICGFLCLSAAGPVSFHTLRLVHRSAEAGGELALLGAGTALVPLNSAHQLRRRAKWIKGIAYWLVLQGAVGLLAIAMFLPNVPFVMRMMFPVWITCWTLCVWSTSAWFLSLMLGAALSSARVEMVVTAIIDANQGNRIDDRKWRDTIEQPAIMLATEVLPLLSKGWGHSVLLVGLGFVAFTIGFAALLYTRLDEWISGGTVGVFSAAICIALLCALGLLPIMLALAPADVSTACDNLKERLTLLRARDPCSEHMRIGALYEVLRNVNKEHGLGFKVGGVVFNRRRLFEALLFLYTVLGTVVPLLLGR